MRVALIQPDPINRTSMALGYGSTVRPPETGLAIIACYLEYWSRKKVSIQVLDPSLPKMQLAYQLASADIAGFSDWYSNHSEVLEMARTVKAMNPEAKIVLGGPNAAMSGRRILSNHHDYLDCVVGSPQCFDGEEALLGLVEGWPMESIPNLCHKEGGITSNPAEPTDLRRIPVWDFRHFQNLEQRLVPATRSHEGEEDPWKIQHIAVESSRGCPKAQTMGPCKFCASGQLEWREYTPMQFWSQVWHLWKEYHEKCFTFYVADNCFTSPNMHRVYELYDSCPNQTFGMRIRGYGYLPYLIGYSGSLRDIGEMLRKMGVFNLFFGLEHTDKNVLGLVNKEFVPVGEAVRVMNALGDQGVGSTLAFMPGLPGETKGSLRRLRRDLRTILKQAKCLERLYISKPVPFVGTAMHKWCCDSKPIRDEYESATGKNLLADDEPDYRLLTRLMMERTHIYFQDGASPGEIDKSIRQMVAIAREYIPEHRIGGFMLE